MTRGRNLNRLHLVAGDLDDAREQFVRALERDRADRGLVVATAAAQESLRGLATGSEKPRREVLLPEGTSFGPDTKVPRRPEVGLGR
jgi:hypothetical protein